MAVFFIPSLPPSLSSFFVSGRYRFRTATAELARDTTQRVQLLEEANSAAMQELRGALGEAAATASRRVAGYQKLAGMRTLMQFHER